MKANIVKIGSKPLKNMTAEQLLQVVLIEECHPVLEFWNEPFIIEFDNKMFSDTLILDYASFRKEDNKRSLDFTFYLDFKRFSFHYHSSKDIEEKNYNHRGNRFGLKLIKYLIKQGFDVPIY